MVPPHNGGVQAKTVQTALVALTDLYTEMVGELLLERTQKDALLKSTVETIGKLKAQIGERDTTISDMSDEIEAMVKCEPPEDPPSMGVLTGADGRTELEAMVDEELNADEG